MDDNLKDVLSLSQRMTDPSRVKRDLEEAVKLAFGTFLERYTDDLKSVMEKQLARARRNPSREAALIYAMKPFLPEASRREADKLADMMAFMDVLMELRRENPGLTAQWANPAAPLPYVETPGAPSEAIEDAIKEDGVYELDQDCLNRLEPRRPTYFPA